VLVGTCVDQLDIHPDAVWLYSYAAFKDVAYGELLADLADRCLSAFVSERGGARDDKAAGERT
jgi:hypothetical protein